VDGSQFDLLTKRVSTVRDRRSLIKAIAVTAAAAFSVRVEAGTVLAASKRRGVGETCRTADQCESGLCEAPDASGRRRCGCGAACLCSAEEAEIDCIICSTDETRFCTMTNEGYVVRSCATGTVCVQSGNCEIICDWPTPP
jgi:hypothetical protein